MTAIYNLFGWPFYSLVPVIGKDNLALGPEGVGVLSSMDGVGAMMGAAWVILLAKPAHYHAVYVGFGCGLPGHDDCLCADVAAAAGRRIPDWRQESPARAMR